MRFLIILALFGLGLQGTDPNHPFPNHEQPPADWFCSREAPDAAHWCLCSGMQDNPKCPMPHDNQTPDDSEDDGQQIPPEDSTCKVFCHRDHCKCMVSCKDSIHVGLMVGGQ